MPLFKCSGCGAAENTALGDYWIPFSEDRAPKCSECATGTWHGRFPKRTPTEAGYIEGKDGFLYRPEELAPGGQFAHVTQPKDSEEHIRP